MSILIKGINLPKHGEGASWIVIYPDSGVEAVVNRFDWQILEEKCVELPPHGRLIDADKLCELCDIMADKCDGIGESIWHQFRTTVEWSSTIIEAEGENNDKR